MARCSKCGKEVGCGCNLINGKCSECRNKEANEAPKPRKTVKKNVHTK